MNRPKPNPSSDHTTIDVPFSGSLRPIQKDVVNAYLQEANHGSGSGTVVLTCGGKNGMWTHSRSGSENIGQYKTFLLDQWKDRINQFLPTAKVGMKGSKFAHCDIVIASHDDDQPQAPFDGIRSDDIRMRLIT
jgi:superfamily II DNA or RNA helicase